MAEQTDSPVVKSTTTEDVSDKVKSGSRKIEAVGGVPKVKWDNPRNDPTKRKSIAEDPTGRENQKLL